MLEGVGGCWRVLEDVRADATGVVGECTGAGALRLPGSPALAVLVMYCRMVVVGGDSGMVVHYRYQRM